MLASATLVKMLDSQLANVDRAPSGLRGSAIEIISDCIRATKDGQIGSHSEYISMAERRWEEVLASRYQGYEQLHAID